MQKVLLKKRTSKGKSAKSKGNTIQSDCEHCEPEYELECEVIDDPDATGGWGGGCTEIFTGFACYEIPCPGRDEDPYPDDDCNNPNNYDLPECSFDEEDCEYYGTCDDGDSEPDETTIIVETVEASGPALVLDEEDEESIFTASAGGIIGFSSVPLRILPVYSYITREMPSRRILSVTQDPLAADPVYAYYTDANGNPAVRYVTLLSQNKYYVITGTSVILHWSCLVNKRYTYVGGQVKTRQSPYSFSKTHN